MRVYKCDACDDITESENYITLNPEPLNEFLDTDERRYDLCEECMKTIEKILTQNGTWIANEKI